MGFGESCSTSNHCDESNFFTIYFLNKETPLRTEEAEALLNAFRQQDNKSGAPVKLSKFKKILAEVYSKYPNDCFNPEIAEPLFKLLDGDGNGTIGCREFITGMTILASGTLEEKAKLTFRAIDKYSSGKINKSEFTSYAAKAI